MSSQKIRPEPRGESSHRQRSARATSRRRASGGTTRPSYVVTTSTSSCRSRTAAGSWASTKRRSDSPVAERRCPFVPSSNAVAIDTEGTGPVGDIAPTPDAVWVSASNELLRIDPASNEIAARLPFDGGVGIAVDETGVWAIAGANREGTVVRIDPDTNRVIDSVPVPNPSFWNDIDAGAGASGSRPPPSFAKTTFLSWSCTGSTL